jgi:hypothetical protein
MDAATPFHPWVRLLIALAVIVAVMVTAVLLTSTKAGAAAG